jgi:transposase-like protein
LKILNWSGFRGRELISSLYAGHTEGEGLSAGIEIYIEMARLKRENAELRMERDILKKAAAYFAKESLRGTRS